MARVEGDYKWMGKKIDYRDLEELQSYTSVYATTKNPGDLYLKGVAPAVELFAESTAMFTSSRRKDVLMKLKDSMFGDLYTFYDDLMTTAMKDAHQGL